MAYMNAMTKLLDKVEIFLGSDAWNLPDKWSKNVWADKVIDLLTIETFSRYFPNKVTVQLDTRTMKYDSVENYYIIDEEMIGPEVEILGVKDIPWNDNNAFGTGTPYMNGVGPYGIMDPYPASMEYEDLLAVQEMATECSLLNRGIYIDFKRPNKIKLSSAVGMAGPSLGINQFKLDLLIKHHKNLTTISPTKMETFEALAVADVAIFLFNKLKHYDGIETVFANVQMHLDELQEHANRRDDILTELKDGYVSAANENQPMIMCI